MKYVLASASPRRQELLTQAGFTFDVIPSAVDEKITKDIPSDVVMELAHQKALDVYESKIKDNPAYQGEDCIVIGADTIVSYRGEVLGKPADNEEAFDMLCFPCSQTAHIRSIPELHLQGVSVGSRSYIHSMKKRMSPFIRSQKRIFMLMLTAVILLTKPALTASRAHLPST